jgi:hypothetical protein
MYQRARFRTAFVALSLAVLLSVVVTITKGTSQTLYTGNIEVHVPNPALGSANFLSAVQAKEVVTKVSGNTSYYHPATEVLDYLAITYLLQRLRSQR